MHVLVLDIGVVALKQLFLGGYQYLWETELVSLHNKCENIAGLYTADW